VLVVDLQCPMIDVDATPRLIELSKTDNTRLQPRDIVDSREGAMFSIPAGENDGHAPFYVGDGTIAKLHCGTHLMVELPGSRSCGWWCPCQAPSCCGCHSPACRDWRRPSAPPCGQRDEVV
jgi:hypothetical protein